MPKLLMFAPCENVIISQGNASLITILFELTVSAPPAPLPDNAIIPMRWFLFAQWEILTGEAGVSFDQRITMVNSEGQPAGNLEFMAAFTPEPNIAIHRTTLRLDHFPLLPAADYRFKLFLRRTGTEEWTEHCAYPFRITHRQGA